MITIYIKNAFGSVRMTDIMNVLYNYNIPHRIIDFINSYLSNRRVIVDDSSSVVNNIGVPQGSSIGPIIWLLVINVLLDNCMNNDYTIIAYADDINILMSATASYYFSEMSKAPIRLIEDWCNNFGLSCSINKCNFTMFSSGKAPTHIPRIKINNVSIKYVKERSNIWA